jgi:hypothetical protein
MQDVRIHHRHHAQDSGVEMSEPVKIFLANARLDDASALAKLLAPFADPASVSDALHSGAALGVAYDGPAQTARFVVTDGEIVSAFSVVGVSASEARAIADACRDQRDFELNAFQSLVAQTLGGTTSKPN